MTGALRVVDAPAGIEWRTGSAEVVANMNYIFIARYLTSQLC